MKNAFIINQLSKYFQELEAKKHFLWLDKGKPEGWEQFTKRSKDHRAHFMKFDRNWKKDMECRRWENIS